MSEKSTSSWGGRRKLPKAFIAAFTQGSKLTPQEADAIRKMIDQAEEKKVWERFLVVIIANCDIIRKRRQPYKAIAISQYVLEKEGHYYGIR